MKNRSNVHTPRDSLIDRKYLVSEKEPIMLENIKSEERALKRAGRTRRTRTTVLSLLVLGMLLFGTVSEAHAATFRQVIMVRRSLVVWQRASLNSPVATVLFRGRHFTVDGRNSTGMWLHGFTDRGTRGWVPAHGLLMLHPEVNIAKLPVTMLSSS
ncbi:MAG TPA: hypothetical protein VMT24_08915, partial [Aggregatilineaceae bacterium]|nr:hypothetical protein [Aggregatilineaceae bacterium]